MSCECTQSSACRCVYFKSDDNTAILVAESFNPFFFHGALLSPDILTVTYALLCTIHFVVFFSFFLLIRGVVRREFRYYIGNDWKADCKPNAEELNTYLLPTTTKDYVSIRQYTELRIQYCLTASVTHSPESWPLASPLNLPTSSCMSAMHTWHHLACR